MEKDDILQAIRRCAEDNGGVPVGRGRFETLTGIREGDWLGRHWARWGDAVSEAGYTPNALQSAYPDDQVLDALAELTRDQGRFPTVAEMRLRRRADPTFPGHNAFNKFGGKAALAARLVEHCGDDPAWADVVALTQPVAGEARSRDLATPPVGDATVSGHVYLIKSGDRYKIGLTTSPDRRFNEFAKQFPDPVELIHLIATDDVRGVERYWHERFKSRNTRREWFKLGPSDVAAFKRWKKIN